MAAGNPFVQSSVQNYNQDPPTDDAQETANNTVEWDKHKVKLADPVKETVESTNVNVSAAFDKRIGNSVAFIGTDYTQQVTDRGKIIVLSPTIGSVTLTLLPAATAKVGFEQPVVNGGRSTATIDGDGTELIDTNETIELLSGQAVMLFCTGTEWIDTNRSRQPALPKGYIDGLILSNNASDSSDDVDISVGAARDAANGDNLSVTSAIGKQISASWVTGGTPGATVGGLSSSLTLTNDTWYHVIIGKVSGTVEIGFDTSLTGANLATDHSFTNTRRLGSVRRGTATNLQFVQDGDDFWLDDPVLDIDATETNTATTRQLTVPPLRVKAHLNLWFDDSSPAFIYIRDPSVSDEAVSPTAAPLGTLGNEAGTAAFSTHSVYTNTSGQVTSRANTVSGTDIRIVTRGWTDRRGKDGTS